MFWLRFAAPGPILVILGITSALLVVQSYYTDEVTRADIIARLDQTWGRAISAAE